MPIFSANGKIQPEVDVKISPYISGEVVELYVKEGDKVAKVDMVEAKYKDILAMLADKVTLIGSKLDLLAAAVPFPVICSGHPVRFPQQLQHMALHPPPLPMIPLLFVLTPDAE